MDSIKKQDAFVDEKKECSSFKQSVNQKTNKQKKLTYGKPKILKSEVWSRHARLSLKPISVNRESSIYGVLKIHHHEKEKEDSKKIMEGYNTYMREERPGKY